MSAVERVVDALSAAGSNPKQRGDQWEALCPAHDDKTPSLGVATGRDGRALINCHAGCSFDDVLAALNLKKVDTFADDAGRRDDKPKILATYFYRDEQGQVLYRVTRVVPKNFWQSPPDGRGGWITGKGCMDGVRRVPYRLPELLEAVEAGRSIFVCEGEKDADAIVRAGEVATCNSGGAGKWDPAFAEFFRGAPEVIVVPDTDRPGYRHARDVVRSLQDSVGAVRVALPDSGKDAADHLAAGLSVDDLVLIDEAELDRRCEDASPDLLPTADPVTPVTPEAPRLGEGKLLRSLEVNLSAGSAFWTADDGDDDWLIPDFVARGRGHALYSPAKMGKSTVALDSVAAASIPGHRAWTNLPAGERITVVYLDYEMTDADLRERLTEFGYGEDDDYSRFHYVHASAFGADLDTREGGAELLAYALAVEADLVVIDTMGRAVDGNENEADTFQKFYKHTGGPLKGHGIALLRLDHAGKDGGKGQRGSSGKNDDVDVVWRLERRDDGSVMTNTHSRMSWVPKKVSIRRTEDEDGVVRLRRTDGGGEWPAGTKEKAAEMDAAGLPSDASRRDAKAAGIGGSNALIGAACRWRKQADDRSLLGVE